MNKKMILLIGFVDISIVCMELSLPRPYVMEVLTKDIVRNFVAPRLPLQSIGRLRRISVWCNEEYKDLHRCPLYEKSFCLMPVCCALAQNYYVCTKALAHCAHVNDEKMFQHWWAYHAVVREKNLSTLLKRDDLTLLKDRMNAYRIVYCEPKKIRKRIFKDTQKALELSDLDVAKTLFVGSNLNVFNLIKEYYAHLKYSFDTGLIENWVLQKACQLNDPSLVRALCGGVIASEWIQCVMGNSTSFLINGLIVNGGLDIDIRGWGKKTLLHYAAEYNLPDIIEILIERGAYVNSIDAKGMTPLHYAVKYRRVASVKALLKSNDADIRFTNNRGKTVFAYAMPPHWESGDERDDRCLIKELLENHARCNVARRKHAKKLKEGFKRV